MSLTKPESVGGGSVGNVGMDGAGDTVRSGTTGGDDGISIGVSPGLGSLSSAESKALSEKAAVSYGDVYDFPSSIDACLKALGAGGRRDPRWPNGSPGRGVGARGTRSAPIAGLLSAGLWRRTDAAVLAVTRSESLCAVSGVFFGLLAWVIRALFFGGPSSCCSMTKGSLNGNCWGGGAASLRTEVREAGRDSGWYW